MTPLPVVSADQQQDGEEDDEKEDEGDDQGPHGADKSVGHLVAAAEVGAGVDTAILTCTRCWIERCNMF